MTEKVYEIYERVAVTKTINYCEECDMSSFSYSGNQGFCGAICHYHQLPLDSGDKHIEIPEWCKIDEHKYPLSGRR